MKRDVPSELREQHITTKLRKQDIEEILEKDKATKAPPASGNPEDSLLVDEQARRSEAEEGGDAASSPRHVHRWKLDEQARRSEAEEHVHRWKLDEQAARLLSDKEKKKKESGIRAARGGAAGVAISEHEEALDRFERREIHDTLPAPPNDDDN